MKDLKETLKRTNTPNFRKNVNYEPKSFEEESNKPHNNDSDEEKGQNGHETLKKPLMKVPTFSRNITNQGNNRKIPPKTNTFVVETPEIVQKPISL